MDDDDATTDTSASFHFAAGDFVNLTCFLDGATHFRFMKKDTKDINSATPKLQDINQDLSRSNMSFRRRRRSTGKQTVVQDFSTQADFVMTSFGSSYIGTYFCQAKTGDGGTISMESEEISLFLGGMSTMFM